MTRWCHLGISLFQATVSLKGKLGLNMLNHRYVLSLKDIFKTYFGSLSQKQWKEILQMPWQEIRKTKQLYLDEALTVMVLFIKLWKLLESFSESCAEIFFGEAQLQGCHGKFFLRAVHQFGSTIKSSRLKSSPRKINKKNKLTDVNVYYFLWWNDFMFKMKMMNRAASKRCSTNVGCDRSTKTSNYSLAQSHGGQQNSRIRQSRQHV